MSSPSLQDPAGPGPLRNQQSHSPPSASNVSRRERQDTAESDIEAREENGTSKAPLRKKQRKQRPVFSCAECRRLKLKCDRQVPCDNCVKRRCQSICPDGVRVTRQYLANPDSALLTRLEQLEGIVSRHGLDPVITEAVPAKETSRTQTPARMQLRSQQATGNRNDSSQSRAQNSPHMASPSSVAAQPPTNRPEEASSSLQQPDDDDHLRGSSSSGPFRYDMLEPPHYEHQLQPQRLQEHPPQTHASDMQFNTVPDDNPDISHRVEAIHEISKIISCDGPVQFGFPTHSTSSTSPAAVSRHSDSNAELHSRHLHYFDPPIVAENVDVEEEQSYGTLVMGQGGRSKYLGPTAGSEWLRDQETRDHAESRDQSRLPSPEIPEASMPSYNPRPTAVPHSFPFHTSKTKVVSWSRYDLLSRLPDKGYADMLVDSYYRSFSWHYNICPRSEFQPVYEEMYLFRITSIASPTEPLQQLGRGRMNYQDLGLIFMILAFGTLHCLELAPNDPTAYELASVAQVALSKGDLLSRPSISGLQALHILAQFSNESEEGRNGDASWPLWGLSMRLIQAMGLHRDGARWNLEPDLVEQRRRVFWECHSADIFQANCNSRPNTLWPGVYDTAYPSQPSNHIEKDYYTLKFELSRIAASILGSATNVQAPPYSTVMELSRQVTDFERQVPFNLRCRQALQALPSIYPDPQAAIDSSPETSSKELHKTLQKFFLSISISETLLFLHRPYFVRALLKTSPDPSQSVYAPSYLTVVERCNAIVQCVITIHKVHRNVSTRHWPLWYHAFNSAVSMGTLIFKSPQNPLSDFALGLINTVIEAFTSAVQTGSSPRLSTNLQWLVRLRRRCQDAIDKSKFESVGQQTTNDNSTFAHLEGDIGENSDQGDPDNFSLLGWRTRLIQRAAFGGQVAKTISQSTPSQSNDSPPQIMSSNINLLPNVLGPTMGGLTGAGVLNPMPGAENIANRQMTSSTSTAGDQTGINETFTNQLLQQFWEPMLLQDAPNVGDSNWDPLQTVNWWDWNVHLNREEGSHQAPNPDRDA
ncbi:hypothetical protein C343_03455 [Cryptococcus neoformans C23]|uniref:Zn(2)-C6 fungal-type domain-containing protein n=1 Tax=Cryptococcus neoformans (strain H99 / ATCC 208821 / CBS 10515 / FGSC 9487) TaxID=235443 RepID=J9VRW1_CRYN9|nr:hypothetical protein CNAG_02476 [Cryptococcus neoformans var. grubii H99]AFR95359.2 hypothetical protein CNAG_02476 [Cryptococcus neoformans var. grubii H99]AUB25155.1 hypothetical protein CKF44_02476 [Cryptococcus neoformans var. grubii]OWZ43591.1 hypothetical protein C343_03455 [Cryptococcus neoformans var. grubii C23]|eukprot:XP_012049700.1 hypothetical protein CNAG_02476 [Cryptococcus neoformans var. grubii H99]